MNVFIDTNIFLSFYHFSNEELSTLENIFASNQTGTIKVILTEQLKNEFYRNRENKIKDALKKFSDEEIKFQLPSFMKNYEEFEQIRQSIRQLNEVRRKLKSKANKDILEMNLVTDKVVEEIFKVNNIVEINDEIFTKAHRRHLLRNPPGKNDSMGDAINWEILLQSVPNDEDLHIISDDGDFYSVIDDEKLNSFLENEWKEKKNSKIYFYRKLSKFTTKHFNGINFSFDTEKEILLTTLLDSGNFATTHSVIAKLEKYSHFSLREVEIVLEACVQNSQVSWILSDDDVCDFVCRIAIPRKNEIKNTEYLEVIEEASSYKEN